MSARPVMPWEPGYAAAVAARPPTITVSSTPGVVVSSELDVQAVSTTGDAVPSTLEKIEQAVEHLGEEALQKALPELQEAIESYARQYVTAVVAGKDPGLVPTVTIVTKTGQELTVADAKSSAWRTFFTGLGFDVIFALIGIVSMLGNFDLLHQAGWVALGALVVKTITTTIASYITRVTVAPSYAKALSQTSVLPQGKIVGLPLLLKNQV